MNVTTFISTFKQAIKLDSGDLDASNISMSSEPEEIMTDK
jgi:hypothetical protein